MTLVCPNSGEIILLKYIVGLVDAGNPVLHLYGNDVTPADTTVIGDLTECTSAGYAPVTLTSVNWTVVQDGLTGVTTAQYTQRSFAFSTAARTYGYYVTDTSNNLLWLERFDGAPYVMPDDGGSVAVVPALNLS